MLTRHFFFSAAHCVQKTCNYVGAADRRSDCLRRHAAYSSSPLLSMTFLYQKKLSLRSRLKSPVPSSNLLT